MTKINLGGGPFWKEPGWENLDLYTGYDVVTRNLQEFPDKSVDTIYTSHFLEHIQFDQGVKLLKSAFRVLKPDGLIRIVVPDIDILTQMLFTKNYDYLQQHNPIYYNNSRKSIPFEHHIKHLIGWDYFESPGSHMHLAFYSESILSSLLKLIGFSNITKCEYANSAASEMSKPAVLNDIGEAVCGFDNKYSGYFSLFMEASRRETNDLKV